MRITKVYTRTGDRGQTRLVGGAQVSKNDARIEAYGTVDELNSVVGLIRTFAPPADEGAAATVHHRLDPMLHAIQNDLFNVGTDLATPAAARWEGMVRVAETDVTKLEDWMDALNEELPPLKEFILPGGGPVGAFFHQARTVCRRAERRTITLIDQEDDVGTGAMRYLNRLSDFLFVAGRWAAATLGEREFLWENPNRRR
jgi:cob(I)alamin adenosyltransferase